MKVKIHLVIFAALVLAVTAKEINPSYYLVSNEKLHGLFKREAVPSSGQPLSIAGIGTNPSHGMGIEQHQPHQDQLVHKLFKREAVPSAGKPLSIAGIGTNPSHGMGIEQGNDDGQLAHGLFKREVVPSAGQPLSIAGIGTNPSHGMGIDQSN